MPRRPELDPALYTGQNALFSVSDKKEVVQFAGGLRELSWNIIASTGTRDAILAAGIDVTDTKDLTGGGAFLGHKVVTLSREVAAGLLADPTVKSDVKEMESEGIPFIHLLAQNSYPMREEIAKPDSTEASIRQNTDIGGPTMLREAAKGRRIIASSVSQYKKILEWLAAGRPDEENFVHELAAIAEFEAANYAMASAIHLGQGKYFARSGVKVADVAYGENGWQQAAIYREYGNTDPLAITELQQQKGAELSYNNIVDFERSFQTMTHIAASFEKNFGDHPAIAIAVKHGNACGVGVADNLPDAVKKMIEGDTRAIHGGVISINGEITEEIAHLLVRYAVDDGGSDRLLDAVACTSIVPEALDILSRKKLRVVTSEAWGNLGADSLDAAKRFRYIRGGMAVQDNYTHIHEFAADNMEFDGPELTIEQKRDLALAAAIGQTSNSNTITLVKDGKLIGNGIGQQDRVGAAQTALARTTVESPFLTLNHNEETIKLALVLDMNKIRGAAAYSDSFQPYEDSAEILVKAGIKSILTSKGGVRFEEVMKVYAKAGVAVATIPDKEGRGFYGH